MDGAELAEILALARAAVGPATVLVTQPYIGVEKLSVDEITRKDGQLPKIIWLLWWQGWDKPVPYVVAKVFQSWRLHNEAHGWQIIALDESNIGQFVDVPHKPSFSLQALSDVIRVTLLARFGGVWADASMICLRPLDEWVWDAIEPVGFWTYHGRDEGHGPASWFIISVSSSLIIQKWKAMCDEYISCHDEPDDYFWLDRLFEEERVQNSEGELAATWRRVPYLYCEDKGSAHYAVGRVGDPVDDDFREHVNESRRPHAMKLCWRAPLSDASDHIGNYVIRLALGARWRDC